MQIKLYQPSGIFTLLFLTLSLGFSSLSAQCDGVSGGELLADNGTRYVPVCLDDEEGLTNVNRSDFSGATSQYFLTNAAGFIIRQLDGAPPFDLTDLRSGVFAIWSTAYSGDLTGAAVGDNICATGATGCFSLSNSLTINRKRGEDCFNFCPTNAGSLTVAGENTTEAFVCRIDGVGNDVAVDLTGELAGDNTTFFITNDDNEILGIPSGSGPFNLDAAGPGTCLIWHIAFQDGLTGLEVGNTPDDFMGCFNLSNPITVERENVDGGRLFLEGDEEINEITICAGDGESDAFNTMLSGAEGENSSYVITNASNEILMVADGPPFDLEGAGLGICNIYHLSWNREILGLEPGQLLSALVGCYDVSGPIAVTRVGAEGGTLAIAEANGGGDAITICAGDGESDAFDVELTDNSGDDLTYVITNGDGVILGLPPTGPFDLDGAGAGICLLYALSSTGDLGGLEIDANLKDVAGCFALSNPITVTRESVNVCGPISEFTATLSGVAEVPCPVTTTGRGSITATLQGDELVVSGSFSGLISDFDPTVAGGAHLHLGMAGMGGPVALLLTSELDDDLRGGSFPAGQNTFKLNDEQIAALTSRGMYVNIHTVDFGAGELRGQLVPADADAYKMAYLLGVNEVPSVVTSAIGGIVVERTGNTITVSGSVNGLTAPVATQLAGGAHIHQAAAGRNGGIVFPLNLELSADSLSAVFAADSNVFELTDEQLEALEADLLYVNVHSTFALGGELRGQLTDMSVASFYANASGHQARPVANNTPGNGRIMVNYDGAGSISVTGSVDDLTDTIATAIAGGGHLHLNVAGANGPVEFALSFSLDEDGRGGLLLADNNTFAVTDEQVATLMAREYYLNVHTGAFPSGEIRGQVMNLAKGYFGSNLAGINSNPNAVKSTGGGFLMYEVCGASFVATGSFAGLSSDFDANVAGGSHVHLGDAAGTGGILVGLETTVAEDLRSGTYAAEDNTFSIDEDGVAALLSGGLYFNLHTVDNPSGEIRGQILRDDNAFPTGPEIILPEDGARVTVSSDSSDLEDGVFAAAEDPNGDLLVYTIEITMGEDTAFASVLACNKVGTDTMSSAAIAAVYDVLIASGAVPGMEVSLRYRVVASDGSVATPGGARTITLIVGENSCNVNAGSISLPNDGGTEGFVCRVDGRGNSIAVELTGDVMGANATFVITNAQGSILGIPDNAGPFNLDAAGQGTCLIYHLAYEDDLTGLATSENIADLAGCFDLTDPITVDRQNVDGGRLFVADTDEVNMITICADDGESDGFGVDLSGSEGDSSVYLITDTDNEILMLVDTPFFDLEGAGAGVCRIYHLSYNRELVGLAPGTRISELAGCFDVSGAITVVRRTGDSCTDGFGQGAISKLPPEAADLLNVFPNPVGNQLTLEVIGLHGQRTDVSLLDLNGRQVMARQQLHGLDGRMTLELNQLPTGTYLLKLTNDGGTSVRRIVKR